MSFLDNKYKWLFKFFDHSGNGSIELTDFQARASRASAAVEEYFNGQEEGQAFLEQNIEVIKSSQQSAYEEFFNHLAQGIDKGADGSISNDEWLMFCNQLREQTAGGDLPDWFKALLERYFDSVLDFDRNGAIDFYELGFMGDAPVEVTYYCYNFLTNGGTEPLDKEAFVSYVKDYMTSEDESDPSRYMFGFIPPQPQ